MAVSRVVVMSIMSFSAGSASIVAGTLASGRRPAATAFAQIVSCSAAASASFASVAARSATAEYTTDRSSTYRRNRSRSSGCASPGSRSMRR